MIRRLASASIITLSLVFSFSRGIAAQQSPEDSGAAQGARAGNDAQNNVEPDAAVANPGRPTVSTPATITPVGYFQFETGYLGAWRSPGLTSQSSLNEVVKFSVTPRLQLLAADGPLAVSRVQGQSSTGSGGAALGVQGILHRGEGVRPTIAVSYFGSVYGGNTPDLDIGSFKNSAILLASADVKGFHYDMNFLFNDVADSAVHRAQFGQTISISHPLGKRFGIAAELWRFTQPFLRGNAIGSLWALNYNLRKNLVLDGGFNRGLTGTSTRWEVFTGFTYVLPYKIFRR